MQEANQYSKARTEDRIAFLAIYIPILRAEILGYTKLWNIHKIRTQRKKRPNAVSGQPMMLYNFPESGITDYGISPDVETLEELRNEVQAFGMLFKVKTIILR